MPIVSDLQEYWTEKGAEKGQRIGFNKAIALGLDLKFGPEGVALLPQIEKIEDLSSTSALLEVGGRGGAFLVQ